MNRLCEGHDGCHSRAGDGAAEPLDGGEAAAEEKELGDADANDCSDELATEEISRLGKGRFDSVELKNSTGTLVSVSIQCSVEGSGEHTNDATIMGALLSTKEGMRSDASSITDREMKIPTNAQNTGTTVPRLRGLSRR